jgi:hypothetical protein
MLPIKNENDNIEDTFCEDLECIFDQLPWNQIKIEVGGFNAKLVRKVSSK